MTDDAITPTAAKNRMLSVVEQVAARLSATEGRAGPRGMQASPVHSSEGAGLVADILPEKLRQHNFLVPGAAANSLSEAFRIAKRHLLVSALGTVEVPAIDRGRAIVVTSSFPNEGKTFCSINLALALASEKDLEVTLVDGDTVKPEILSLLGLGGTGGLMDALASGEPPQRYIIQTSIPNLSVLPAGRRAHDDIELLGSRQMRAFTEEMLAEKPGRILLFDSAPALSASSGPVLAGLCGQVLMVVRADRTREEQLADAIRLFGGHRGLQLLLNRTTFSPPGESYGYYYGYER